MRHRRHSGPTSPEGTTPSGDHGCTDPPTPRPLCAPRSRQGITGHRLSGLVAEIHARAMERATKGSQKQRQEEVLAVTHARDQAQNAKLERNESMRLDVELARPTGQQLEQIRDGLRLVLELAMRRYRRMRGAAKAAPDTAGNPLTNAGREAPMSPRPGS